MFKTIVSSLCLLMSVCLWAQESDFSDVRDPTAPLGHISGGAVNSEQQFTLNSILVSPQRKVAIINGSVLREGQVVPGSDDVKVQKISSQTVVLQQTNKTWVLKLLPDVVRRN